QALRTQSLFLADLARQLRQAGEAGTALLLALEALPDAASGTSRPYVPDAEYALDGARQRSRERMVLKGHEASVSSAAFSPDGRRIVTTSLDEVRQWDAATGRPIGKPLTADADRVWSAALSPDGRRIVITLLGGTGVRQWDAATGRPLGELLRGDAKVS